MNKPQYEFEDWAANQGMHLKKDGVVTTYAYYETDQAWQVWQASRAAIVIQLPFSFKNDTGKPFGEMLTLVANAVLAKCYASIEAAGIPPNKKPTV